MKPRRDIDEKLAPLARFTKNDNEKKERGRNVREIEILFFSLLFCKIIFTQDLLI